MINDPTADWLRGGAKDFGPTSGLFVLTVELSQAMSEQLKVLLETKHLYQKVLISPEKLVAAFKQRVAPASLRPFEELTKELLASVSFIPAKEQLFREERDGPRKAEFTLLLSGLKLFCSDCNGREVANPIWFGDLKNELLKLYMHREESLTLPPPGFQLFLLSYQCQRCRSAPQAFLCAVTVGN